MRKLCLREYQPQEETLSIKERDALADFVDVTPVAGDRYMLRPGSMVGALEIGDLSVLIRPKLKVSRVLYLASYAMGAFKLREELFEFEDADTLIAALAPAFVGAAQRAFGRGLLHGYQTREEALYTVRGRIAFAEQIRRRFDVPLPVEVRYDDFTDDIEANRQVKAAAMILGGMRIEHAETRDGLRRVAATLANVTPVHYRRDDLPEVKFDRLNAHYREVVELARLILRHASFESQRGGVRATGFLIDMNKVFEEFITRALREELRLSEGVFRANDRPAGTLDMAGKVNLKPDLSWWEGRECVFVGDAKYKRTEHNRATNADLYQALAYATALDLPGAMLIYAEGEAEPVTHRVQHAEKWIDVVSVDLSGEIEKLQASVATLAKRIYRVALSASAPAA